jgi:hypothetical protein
LVRARVDVQDCQWLQRLMSYGLLRPAFRPGADVCVIRAVARQREVLLTQQASWVQRMQKALVQMNIQLTEVISDVMEQTGQAIICDIVAGQRDPKTLARHRHRRVKASEQDIVRALTGNWREEHLFVLGQALAMYDDIAAHLRQCDTKLGELLAQRSAARVDIGKAPRAGSKMAAMSLSHSDSALGAFYRRLCSRMNKPRANTATAHKLARMVYFMLTRGQAYVDEGQQSYEEQQRQRSVAALKRRAAALGFQINSLGAIA